MLRAPGRVITAVAVICLCAGPAGAEVRVDGKRVLVVDDLPAPLTAGWEFTPGDPPEGLIGLEGLRFRPIGVPGTWEDQGFPPHGAGWYRLVFDLDATLVATPLAFQSEEIRDVDEVYLDGQLAGRSGRFPPDYDKATLIERVYPLPPTRTSIPGRHTLLVRVFNPGPRGGGLTHAPLLDALDRSFHARVVREGPRALLAAAFAAIGLFSLFLHLRDRSQSEFFYLALSSVGTAIASGATLSVWTLWSVPLSFLFRVAMAGLFLVPGATLFLFLRFFGRPATAAHRAVVVLQAAGALFCAFWPRVDDLSYALPAALVIALALLADALVSLGRGVRRKVPYARLLMVPTALLLLAAAHDGAEAAGLALPRATERILSSGAFFLLTSAFLVAMADRFARLRLAASTDPLTGLANRLVLFDRISLEIARAKRNGNPVALALLDLDHFKAFNDRHGHVAGDRLLVAAAGAMTASTRDTDLVARFGGEEFVVLLPETDAQEAITCLERIRAAVGGTRLSASTGGVTVSAGVAVFDPLVRATVSVTAWLKSADAALYAAKSAGRNRVKLSEGLPGSTSGITPALGTRRRDTPAPR